MKAQRHANGVTAGFTLLEVVLGIGISTVLLYAVYSAVAMHYAQLVAGREIAEHAQLVRALQRQIQRDIHSCFTQWRPAQEAVTDEATGETFTETGTEQLVPGGVIGTEESLSLVVRVAPTDLDFDPNLSTLSGAVNVVGDVRMIQYAVGPYQDGETQITGLVRNYSYRLPDEDLGDTGMTVAQLVAPEVKLVQFSYYDGAESFTTWDTTQTGPPLAIRVMIGVVDPRLGLESGADDQQITAENLAQYQFTVALPDPFSGEAGAGGTGGGGAATGAGEQAEGGLSGGAP